MTTVATRKEAVALSVAWKKFLSNRKSRSSPRKFLDKQASRPKNVSPPPQTKPEQAREFVQRQPEHRPTQKTPKDFLQAQSQTTKPRLQPPPREIIPQPLTPPPPPQKKYLELLRDTSAIGNCLKGRGEDLNWCTSALKKLRNDIDKAQPAFANLHRDELSEELADKTVSILSRLIPPLQTCYRSANRYSDLITAIENYFKSLGVSKALNPKTGKDFAQRDDYEDWIDLNLDSSITSKSTDDRKLHNKIFRVDLPPYQLRCGEDIVCNFGGECVVWSCRRE